MLIGQHSQRSCFFQAEDGIRDDLVTGVQTCALPILTGNNWINQVRIEGQSDSDTGTGKDFQHEVAIATRSVSPDYFDAMGLGVLMGRGFRANDAWYGPDAVTNAPFVAIINKTMAEKYFADRNPVGSKRRFSP